MRKTVKEYYADKKTICVLKKHAKVLEELKVHPREPMYCVIDRILKKHGYLQIKA